jgi:hypothetical protein
MSGEPFRLDTESSTGAVGADYTWSKILQKPGSLLSSFELLINAPVPANKIHQVLCFVAWKS